MENKTIEKLNGLKKQQSSDLLEVKIIHNGKELYKYDIEVDGFRKEVINDKKFSLFYFFKDVKNALEDVLIKRHKEMLFEEIEKNGSK